MSVAELQELERDHAIATYARNPVQFVRGSGCRLWDDDGNEYLDFLAGISVLNVGHCHPRVVEAVREQVGRLTHVTNLYYTEPGLRLMQRLSDSSLGGKVFLTDVEGWLRDPADPRSVVSEASAVEVIDSLPSVSGGMRPKLQACVDAIAGGVTYSHIVDGRLPHSLLLELFTDAGIGTKVRPAT